MKRISIAIPDQLHRDLKTLAVYQDETLTSLVTRLLKSHLHQAASPASSVAATSSRLPLTRVSEG
jgi:hypothetical protein